MKKIKNFAKKHKKQLIIVAVAGAAVIGGVYLGKRFGVELKVGKKGVYVVEHKAIAEVLADAEHTYGTNMQIFTGWKDTPISGADLGEMTEGIKLAFGEDVGKLQFTHFIAIGEECGEPA